MTVSLFFTAGLDQNLRLIRKAHIEGTYFLDLGNVKLLYFPH